MKITNIIEIPKFISIYINKGIDDIDYQLHSFCKYLLNRKVDSFSIDSETEDINEYRFEYIVDATSYDIKYFINFYLDKLKLDYKFNCLYEEETELPKSLSNEIFIIELETDDGSKLDTIKVYIESFESDKLILKSI